MKIVDEKGKLFGKLNIVDLLVILLLVAAVVLVGLKLAGRGGVSGGAGTTLTYTVTVQGVPQAAYDNLQRYIDPETGDQLMANGELLDAYVKSVTATPHSATASVATNNPGERVQVLLDENTLDLTFVIEAKITNTTITEVGTQEVRIGKTHIVKTTHFEFEKGVVVDCEWTPAA